MCKKFFAVILVVIGFAAATYAGTDVIQDYSGAQPHYNYAPQPLPPPHPIYYAPPPPLYFSIFPAYGYYGPRFGYGYHRYYGRRFVHPYHGWR